MKIITLTAPNGSPVYIKADAIIRMTPSKVGGAIMDLSCGLQVAKEPISEIMAKLNE